MNVVNYYYEKIHIFSAVVDVDVVDHSKFSNLSNWKEGRCPENITHTYELNKLSLLPVCCFIAQLVEHCTGIAGSWV